MAAVINRLRHQVTPHTDKRIGLMNEMINSMRLIKMYAWEQPFADQVLKNLKNLLKSLQALFLINK